MTKLEVRSEVKALIEGFFSGNVSLAMLKYHLLVLVLHAFEVKYSDKDFKRLIKSL